MMRFSGRKEDELPLPAYKLLDSNSGSSELLLYFQSPSNLKNLLRYVMIDPMIEDGSRRPLNRAIIHGTLPGGTLPVIAWYNTTLG